MNKLLEKAKSYKAKIKGEPKLPITKDELGLALAYLDSAYAAALGLDNAGSASHRIGVVLRYEIENDLIRIKPV
jgi:hypothetical protein